jgi:adenosylcobinamide-GDP ribazoletransferase
VKNLPFIGNFPKFLQSQMHCFLAAFRFLTIIPIGRQTNRDDEFFQYSLPYFPLIGGIIGVFVGYISLGLTLFLPGNVIANLTIVLLAAASGCLHLDGLADTADGFLSSRPKENILKIMRDSRTGAMGVIALVLVILLKYAALSSLPAKPFFSTVCLMPLAGRCAIVFSMVILPYAREEGGLGNLFYSTNCRKSAMWSLFFLFAPFAFIEGRTVFLVGMITLGTVLFFSIWCRQKIDGATGDTLGAVCEITEMSVAVGMANTLWM